MSNPKPPRAILSPFIVNSTTTHTYTFILLHGLGSNGEDFGRELLETGRTSNGSALPQLFPGAKFIFPTSRWRRSTAFGRSMLTSWFDIVRLDEPSYRKELQIQGLSESVREILELVSREENTCGIKPCNIIIGGISQGCATSLSTLLCLDHAIGGFIGMSGFLPFREDIEEAVIEQSLSEDDPFSRGDLHSSLDPSVKATLFERDLVGLAPPKHLIPSNTARSTPVFLGHGSADEKVQCAHGERMADAMRHSGYQVTWKCYQGQGHWYKVPDEIDDLVVFLRSVLE